MTVTEEIIAKMSDAAKLARAHKIILIAAVAREIEPGHYRFISGVVSPNIKRRSNIIKLAATLARVNDNAVEVNHCEKDELQ